MWFKTLGPLEVVTDGRQIPLGGSKQRATLGYLLLHPNQTVPISRLLKALWSVEEAPMTARKILQNAVWGLRRTLVTEGSAQAPVTLRTQAPGYSLDVTPDRIDLHLFHRWVEEGRSRLAAGEPDRAALLLSDALELWRGPALADLTEVGLFWPELTTLQNTRLDVLEDLFEAQLACGRHYAVLGELESMVENEPLRGAPAASSCALCTAVGARPTRSACSAGCAPSWSRTSASSPAANSASSSRRSSPTTPTSSSPRPRTLRPPAR